MLQKQAVIRFCEVLCVVEWTYNICVVCMFEVNVYSFEVEGSSHSEWERSSGSGEKSHQVLVGRRRRPKHSQYLQVVWYKRAL